MLQVDFFPFVMGVLPSNLPRNYKLVLDTLTHHFHTIGGDKQLNWFLGKVSHSNLLPFLWTPHLETGAKVSGATESTHLPTQMTKHKCISHFAIHPILIGWHFFVEGVVLARRIEKNREIAIAIQLDETQPVAS